jgi:hypothetical protein
MRKKLQSHLTYANVMATLAVVMVLGGSAYAAQKISGSSIKSKSISNVRIKNDTLTGGQINEGTLGQVPEAQHAKTADTATTVLNQVNTPISVRQVLAFSTVTTTATDAKTVTASCTPNTEKAIAGGAAWVNANNNTTVVNRNVLSTSRPDPPAAGTNNATGWTAAGKMDQPLATPARRLMAIAMCTPK